MRKTLQTLLIIGTALSLLTGCKKSETNSGDEVNALTATPSPQPTSVAETGKDKLDQENPGSTQRDEKDVAPDEAAMALAAYRQVLQSEMKLKDMDLNQDYYLKDFLDQDATRGTIQRFTVLDMNHDNIPEVVLEIAKNQEEPTYKVLHYSNDEVYGCNFVYRAMKQLKADGTFSFSSGAADSGFGALRFENYSCEVDILASSESSWNKDELTISYFINQKPVTEAEFNAILDTQDQKEDAVWYEFSQENMDKLLLLIK